MSAPRHLDCVNGTNTETTPLLPRDDDHQDSITSKSQEAEVDELSIDLALAKTLSIPHGGEIEPGFPLPPEGDPDGPSTKQDTSGTSAHFINVSPARFWVIFGGIMFSFVIAFFDATLMGSIHPVITSHFHASNSASWLSTAFLLTCTAFQPLIGRLSDTFGRRPLYLVAIVVFFITTAWCAVAQSIGSFIAARAFCGVGAGAVTSIGLIMSSDLVHVEYRGIYQSYINIGYGSGCSLGLAFGGFLADTIGWRAAFGIQLPFIFAYLIAAYFTTPSDLGPCYANQEGFSVSQALKSIDLKGSFFLVTAVTALILGLNLGGNVFSWGHPVVISSLVGFCVIAFIFIKVERKVKRPVMPLHLLSSNPHANLIFSNFFSNITINTVLFNAPLFFQAVKQESPTKSGFRLVAASIVLMVVSVSTGFLITWTRRLKPALVLGSIFFIYAGVTMSKLHQSTPDWTAMASIIPSSLGQGFVFPTAMVAILATSAQSEQAVVTTTLGLFRNLGSVMGVAISSWVLQNTLLVYLESSVTGADKADIIERVRKSITAISELDSVHRNQVIYSYEKALRSTFLSSIVWSSIVLFLLAPISLPKLRSRS